MVLLPPVLIIGRATVPNASNDRRPCFKDSANMYNWLGLFLKCVVSWRPSGKRTGYVSPATNIVSAKRELIFFFNIVIGIFMNSIRISFNK